MVPLLPEQSGHCQAAWVAQQEIERLFAGIAEWNLAREVVAAGDDGAIAIDREIIEQVR